MMSPAAYQPKPDVADIEMVDGGMGGGAGGMDGAARKKVPLFGGRLFFAHVTCMLCG